MHDFSHCYSEVVAPVVACTFAGETGWSVAVAKQRRPCLQRIYLCLVDFMWFHVISCDLFIMFIYSVGLLTLDDYSPKHHSFNHITVMEPGRCRRGDPGWHCGRIGLLGIVLPSNAGSNIGKRECTVYIIKYCTYLHCCIYNYIYTFIYVFCIMYIYACAVLYGLCCTAVSCHVMLIMLHMLRYVRVCIGVCMS